MPRQYLNIKEKEQEIMRLHYDEGLTAREISERLKLPQRSIENAITRFNRRKKNEAKGIYSKPKGRPRKTALTLEEENQRLKMENELLKDFLKEIGRG